MDNLGAFQALVPGHDMPGWVANAIMVLCFLLAGAILYHCYLIDHPKVLIGTRVGRNFERELNGWVQGNA